MLLTRKRIAWESHLDIPVGLTSRQEPGAGTETISQVLIEETDPTLSGPGMAGTQAGWLVILTITNPGIARVRGWDFRPPLTFTFPGREIRAIQIIPPPAVPAASTAPQLPAARVSVANYPAGDHAGRLELSGDFLFRPGHSCSVVVILRGTPACTSPRIQQEGSLTGGKIIATPDTQPWS